ncbi:MAG: DUF2254 domain-containing protein [Pseudomonadota bacterium]|nr:DUF2254 domain-containing protein [Pseudomonadota bacterium]
MLSKWQWLLKQLVGNLWWRASILGIVALVTVLAAYVIQFQFDLDWVLPFTVGQNSVGKILHILATSLLGVTTFSLSVMVSAYSAASSSVTPRATKLVRQDSTTHNVLATFIGAFQYSLIGIIALEAGIFNETGRFVLFLATIVIIVVILVALLRWIEHLSRLGRVSETTILVEQAAADAIAFRVEYPHLGAKLLDLSQPPSFIDNVFYFDQIGYIQHMDLQAINDCAKAQEGELALLIQPGDFIHPKKPIGAFSGEMNEDLAKLFCSHITLGNDRTFEHDARFGMQVMAEIASRALSPAVNDPGTASDVIARSVRLLAKWKDHKCLDDDDERIHYPQLYAEVLDLHSLFNDFYTPIARDGAAMIEILIRLFDALSVLKQISPETFGTVVYQFSEEISNRGKLFLQDSTDLLRLEKERQRIFENTL